MPASDTALNCTSIIRIWTGEEKIIRREEQDLGQADRKRKPTGQAITTS